MWLKLIEKILSPSKQVGLLKFLTDEKIIFKEWQFLTFEKFFEADFNRDDVSNFRHWNGELKSDQGGNWLTSKKTRRSYSIASSMKQMENNEIYFIVKLVEGGLYSTHLLENMQIWETIDYIKPLWHLTLPENIEKNILMISTGSWVVPMVSMYDFLCQKNPNIKVFNIFGERYYDNILDYELEIFQDKNQYKNQFFLSKDKKDWFQTGYVQNWILEALEYLWKDINIFLCWKPETVKAIQEMLLENWIEKSQIKSEKY